MDVEPRFSSNPIKMDSPVQKVVPTSRVIKDPERLIPNGIYKVIKWEVLMQKINIVVAALVFLVSLTTIFLFALVYKNAWATFILPILFLLVAFFKFYLATLEHRLLRREITRYREDLKLNLATQPPLIMRIYRNTFIRQVRHNWITFFIIFNGTIFTLLLWWLKDFSWWILEFRIWIKQLFWNPDTMTILFAIGLISVFVLHVFFAIHRKKRLLEIEAYSGAALIPANEIDILKARLNKAYRRLFIIYILVILVIPFIIWLVFKFFKKK